MRNRPRKLPFTAPEGVRWQKTPEGKEHLARIARARHKAGTLGNYKNGQRKRPALRIKPLTSSARSNGTARLPHSRSPKAAMEAHEALLTQARAQEIAYIYGRIESQLEVYANKLGIPFLELARGIRELLHSKTRG